MKKSILTLLTGLLLSAALPVTAFAQELIVGGQAVGIRVRTEGVLVSGTAPVETAEGAVSPAEAAGRGRPDVCVLRRRGDLRGLRLQPRHRREAAFGAGADRSDRAKKAGPGQTGSDLCPAILHQTRLLDFPKGNF